MRLVPGQRRQQLSFGVLLQQRSLLARLTARRRQHRQPGASIVGGWFPRDEAVRLEAIDQLRAIRFQLHPGDELARSNNERALQKLADR